MDERMVPYMLAAATNDADFPRLSEAVTNGRQAAVELTKLDELHGLLEDGSGPCDGPVRQVRPADRRDRGEQHQAAHRLHSERVRARGRPDYANQAVVGVVTNL